MKNLFLIGFMGAGKSSVSAGLGRMLGREVVEMDQRIAAQEGMSIPELFAQKGEPYFRACETALLKSFAQGAPRIVSCGGGVPLREENVVAMRESGTVVLLTASPEVILERVKDSHDRPVIEGRKTVEYIRSLMEKRREKYMAAADFIVNTDKKSAEEICRELVEKLEECNKNIK